ncbi:MAG TPA: PDZ domain-containing protein [Candidatus Acidoferrales bacterium]|nr:PDZ domain-containing protein [Candidatus Acidoferrales bacterium]
MNKFVLAKSCFVLVAVLSISLCSFADPKAPLLLQTPTLSATQIAFVYAGDIWIVARAGGEAHRLVTGRDLESGPIFSPDGSMVAFSGNYDSNTDVYVVPSTGGEPRRLTYHPGADVAVGWTPDGKSVLFSSHRASTNDPDKLFTVGVTGGFPTELPLEMGEQGSYSPDGSEIAYVPIFQWEPDWKGYRGGQTTPIWIAKLSDSSIVKVPREESNDRDPMWVGKTVYFLSDRDGPRTLFAYDTETQKIARVIDNKNGFDISSASAGDGAIVYAQFGSLHVYDVATRKDQPVSVIVSGDAQELLPRWEKVSRHILNSDISPTGARAVFEAHGEILTVPAEKGDARNITNTPGTAERDPAWSPDGKWIAYFSDASGNYELHVRDQKGLDPARVINLGNPPTFYYRPTWSPDSKRIAYADKRLNLWFVDLDHPAPVKVDTNLFEFAENDFNQEWSPDSQWIVYTKVLPNHQHAVFVYSLETGKGAQITDGMSDCQYPNFDKNGKYIYFAASTNTGLSAAGLDMSSDEHPVTMNVYVAVLRKDLPSPIPPESDDEKSPEATAAASKASGDKSADKSDDKSTKKAADSAGDKSDDKSAAKTDEKPKEPPKVTIDFENILQRILTLPIPAANYVSVSAGKEGELFLVEAPMVALAAADGPSQLTVSKFDLKTRKTDKLLSGISVFALSFNGEKMLYKQGENFFIADSSKPPEAGKGQLKTDDLEVRVVPREEWNQMYREVWHIERDFFYDPHYHGLDLTAAEKEFSAYLPGISSRSDLNYLFREMLSYMSVGHMFIRGGTEPETPHVSVGLLGADYAIENGHYRFKKIYSGENWNPRLQAPLTQPGVNVKEGEYLLAVDGRQITSSDELYAFFQETAGKQVVLKVGPNSDGTGSRDVIVVPMPSEDGIRNLDWIEANRRKVDELSGGKLAYVYLPDTAAGGYTNFNRYFFAQVGKQGVILDERFNHGGQVADYIIDYLRRQPMDMIISREGAVSYDPAMAIYGPKVMIINQFAGSGGDAMPWLFRKSQIGTLVGVRTWGGLVGIGGYPVLMDGGFVTAPREAIAGLDGAWEVEGRGIAPDIEVWQDPQRVREGHDPQLERAVAEAMLQLKDHPLPTYKAPPYIDHHPQLPPVQ